MSEWETPSFVELRMDAEVGSYQADDPGEAPPIAREHVAGPSAGAPREAHPGE